MFALGGLVLAEAGTWIPALIVGAAGGLGLRWLRRRDREGGSGGVELA